MSAAWKYICPVCNMESHQAERIRQHCRDKTTEALHLIAASLPDIAFENPAFGERKFGVYGWSESSPQGKALAPLHKAMLALP